MIAPYARLALLGAAVVLALPACSSDSDANEMGESDAMVAMADGASYKREVPADLAAKATILETRAAEIALALVPGGTIESVELEEEDGKLLYSYDIRVAGKEGIEEIHVDAMTGEVLANEHETPEDEKAEAEEDEEDEPAGETPFI